MIVTKDGRGNGGAWHCATPSSYESTDLGTTCSLLDRCLMTPNEVTDLESRTPSRHKLEGDEAADRTGRGTGRGWHDVVSGSHHLYAEVPVKLSCRIGSGLALFARMYG